MSFAYVDKEAILNKPTLWICKPNKKRIGKLIDAYNISLSTEENKLSELTFTIPVEVERDHELVENPDLKKLKGYYLIEVVEDNGSTEYFIITNNSGKLSKDGVEKSFTLYSYAHQLAKKFIVGYEGTSKTLSQFIMDFLVETSWKIGSVDVEFDRKYRSFEASNNSVLQCIFDIAQKFGAMVEFNTKMKTVNFYKSSRGMNRGLRFKEGVYLESFEVQYDFDSIKTRVRAYGQEGLEFRSLTPTASNYIENFSWFMYPFEYEYTNGTYKVLKKSDYMSDELCIALVKYNKLLEEYDKTFGNISKQKTDKEAELKQLMIELEDLNIQLRVYQNELDVINATYGDEAPSRADYQQCIANINNQNSQIASKLSAISSKENEIKNLETQISQLNETLKIENNLTRDEILELDEFVLVEEYVNDSITEEQDLLDEAKEVLEEISKPKITLSIDLANFSSRLQNDENRKKIILGDTVIFNSAKLKEDLRARISGINRDFEKGKVSLTISNVRDSKDETERLYEMIYGSASTSNAYNLEKFKYNQAVSQLDDVSKFINSTYDATLFGIKGGVNSNVQINERGIFTQSISEPNRMLVIQGGQLAISDDSLQSVKVAISPDGVVADRIVGRIILGNKLHIEDELGIVKIESGTVTTYDDKEVKKVELGKFTGTDGRVRYGLKVHSGAIEIVNGLDENNLSQGVKNKLQEANGVRADLRLTAPLPTSLSLNENGITAYVSGNSSKFARMDYRGLYVQGGAVDVRTGELSNRGVIFNGNGISAYNSSGTRTFYVDTDGNLTATKGTFTGTVNATDGTFSGTVYATDGSFSGTVYASSGSFRGTVNASGGSISGNMNVTGTLSGGTISGSYISGGTVYGSKVEGVSITGGSISGTTITGGSISSGTTIDIGTDVNVGNNITLGTLTSRSDKSIIFNGVARIVASWSEIRLSAPHISFSDATSISWGNNKPQAVFG